MSKEPAKAYPDGFTIIETMFVLAIGGLILMLVFMMIPILQRNGRNNQRQQDVSSILSAISHYELNNSGNFPAGCGVSPQLCTFTGPSLYAKLTYYDPTISGNVQIVPETSTSSLPSPVTNADQVMIYNYNKCGSGGAVASTGGGFNNIVALYALETGGSPSPQCREL